jgi:hypothetical protein
MEKMNQIPDKYPSNHFKKWSDEEEIELLEELNKNIDIEIIALNHNRTKGGISSRCQNIAYKMYLKNISIEEIIEKTKLDEKSIKKTIEKKKEIIKKIIEMKKEIENPLSIKDEINQLKNEINELKKYNKELVENKATIQHINIYDDGLIEMVVICDNCKKTNCHTITHSSTKNDDKTTIDFSKLGKRCCDNHSVCYSNYQLYM